MNHIIIQYCSYLFRLLHETVQITLVNMVMIRLSSSLCATPVTLPEVQEQSNLSLLTQWLLPQIVNSQKGFFRKDALKLHIFPQLVKRNQGYQSIKVQNSNVNSHQLFFILQMKTQSLFSAMLPLFFISVTREMQKYHRKLIKLSFSDFMI